MHDSTAQTIAQPDKSSAGPSTEVSENQLSWHFGATDYLGVRLRKLALNGWFLKFFTKVHRQENAWWAKRMVSQWVMETFQK